MLGNMWPFGRRERAREAPTVFSADPIGEALSDREAEVVLGETRFRTRSQAELSDQEAIRLAARVSARALALIVRHETGGRDYYERVYKARPVWPQASSGVTIGFGYDLGYQTSQAAIGKDWKGALPDRHIDMLEPAVGLAAVEPGREDRIERIQAIISELVNAGVTIPWSAAETVFRRVTVPRFAAITAEALPGHEQLTADCFGALVSLTFNRGPSFGREHDPEKDPKDRYREMRGIKQALGDGGIERIPGLIREMKRIWNGTAIAGEMARRRENEARLFEDGLSEIVVAAADARAAASAAGPTGEPTRGGTLAIAGVVEADINDEALEDRELERRQRGIDFPSEIRRSSARVGWARDVDAPDYAHLNNKIEPGVRFKLTAGDLQLLADLNSFAVADAGSLPVLFGLRGCGIIEDNEGAMGKEVLLRDQRPDHVSTRCVIGVWDRAAKQIAVFESSTVPEKNYVESWYENSDLGNMLPTGFYGYIVGVHNGRPGCFLLRDQKDPDRSRQVIVRRSSNNMIYERADVVSKSRPGDNLHPTFSDGPTDFNSAGCQVVRGNATKGSGNHRGAWARFRLLAGLKTATGKPGTAYSYMLLTGLEAMLAARARVNGATDIPEVRESLMRLRCGSKGGKVERLQKFLGVPVSGVFDVATAEKLYVVQQNRWKNVSDGIFSPELDAELRAGVFSDVPAEVVTAGAPQALPQTPPIPEPKPQPHTAPQQAPAPAPQGAPPAAPASPAPVPTAAPVAEAPPVATAPAPAPATSAPVAPVAVQPPAPSPAVPTVVAESAPVAPPETPTPAAEPPAMPVAPALAAPGSKPGEPALSVSPAVAAALAEMARLDRQGKA